MALFIRDDGVGDLAAALARSEGRTLTDSVRGALQDKLDRKRQRTEEKIRRTLDRVADMKGLPDLRPGFTDKDLYDEDGNPIL